jgi:hypothetical protein
MRKEWTTIVRHAEVLPGLYLPMSVCEWVSLNLSVTSSIVFESFFVCYFLHCVKHLNDSTDLTALRLTKLFQTRSHPYEAPAAILCLNNKTTGRQQNRFLCNVILENSYENMSSHFNYQLDSKSEQPQHMKTYMNLCVQPQWNFLPHFTSCRSLFKKLQILPIPCQYIQSILNFVVNNHETFQTNLEIHNINTRNKHHLHRPNANLSCFQKSAHYAGIRIFNRLPLCLSVLTNDKAKFKKAVQKYLNTHSFYSVDEFLMCTENNTVV